MNPDHYTEWLLSQTARHRPISPEEQERVRKKNALHQKAVLRRRKRKRGGPK